MSGSEDEPSEGSGEGPPEEGMVEVPSKEMEQILNFVARFDYRRTKRVRLKKVRIPVYLTDEQIMWMDAARQAMGLSRSAFIGYCIYKVTLPYRRSYARRKAGQKSSSEE